MSKAKQLKPFDLDAEIKSLAGWSASGGVIRTYKGSTGKKMPDCTADNPCLREGWYQFGGEDQQPTYEYVQYQVRGDRREVVNGLDNPFHARLIAAAPDLLRFVKDIAEGKALALSVVKDAKSLLKEVRQGVPIPGKHDYTLGPLWSDDYPTKGEANGWATDDD